MVSRIVSQVNATKWLDYLLTLATWATAASITAVFLWIVLSIVGQGLGQLSLDFLLSEPMNAGREGGIAPILVSTLLILGVCLAIALPLGLATALLLAEFTVSDKRLGMWVRRSLDFLAGVPSIVFGLFGSVFFSKVLGLGFSILSGGLTLACMVLPLLIRATEEGLRSQPASYRQGAAALGLSKTTTLFKILLPAALPGLMVGLVLSMGRALAETAALIFTSGYVDRFPESLLDSGRALSIHIFDLSMNVPGGDGNAAASALVLLGMLLGLNGLTALITWRWSVR
ncbi:phosphate ABC transporter permease PstA [Leptothoe sp. EHU-05/26/07-4]|uniref:Phosphate transport system permease protein PstA n=1 Tax=Adonisia turfae CCMR0081 TaxID=2292702 RepID=A0A6M0RLS9_9CYAN|nr:phosphate ABC transporter permease PstA [Adonisia turfae]NEZ57109.1 phosphate ABC transporter permease PstA [Adonisia turfae CCMR0081]